MLTSSMEVGMKNTVKVASISSIIVATILYLIDTYMINISGLFGYLSILISLTVIVIGFVIFLENRHPTQTLTWLIVLGGFPLVGFIFYLLFGRNYRKEKMFRKKYFLDKQTFMQYEGQDPVSERKIKSNGDASKKTLLFGTKIRKQSDFVWNGYKSIDKWRRDVSSIY